MLVQIATSFLMSLYLALLLLQYIFRFLTNGFESRLTNKLTILVHFVCQTYLSIWAERMWWSEMCSKLLDISSFKHLKIAAVD